MKNLPTLFTLTVSILLAGMAQVGRSASFLAGPGANAASPAFSVNVLALSPLLVRTMASLSTGIQQPAPPDTGKSSDPASSPINKEITVTHDRTTWNLSPAGWAIGAVILVAVIAIIAMATRGSSGTTIVRG